MGYSGFPVHPLKGKTTLAGDLSTAQLRHYISMQTIDVPQSASLYRYMEKKDGCNGNVEQLAPHRIVGVWSIMYGK